jgi:hypothetical protein
VDVINYKFKELNNRKLTPFGPERELSPEEEEKKIL